MTTRKTVGARELARTHVRLRVVQDDESTLPSRPRTRGECRDVPRPCPHVSCRQHLFLDVNPKSGSIKFNFPDLEPGELPADRSCALDIADGGAVTLEEVGEAINVVRERARQIELDAVTSVHRSAFRSGPVATLLAEYALNPDPNRPPTTAGMASRASAEDDEPRDEDAWTRTVTSPSIFDPNADDADVCDAIWAMATKKWGVRSKKSLAATRRLEARREKEDR